ncbi:MAG: putative efflux protein family [Clostridia bacterium]|nr:putative efflux protein family [Clostridia bacterium]
METNRDIRITMPVSRLLLKFSLPTIGGMIVNSLYNLVDRIFVGRIGGLAMTGIGLSLPFMLMLSSVSSLVGIGASALISIKLGEDNKDKAKGLLGNAITLLIGLMLLMTLLGLILPNFLGLNGVWGASALSDLISSLIAIVALKSAFNHLNRLDSEYRSAETETLSEIAI